MKNKSMLQSLRTVFMIGLLTAVSSEIYLSLLVANFRVSPAVIVFPVLLLTVGRNIRPAAAGFGTMLVVLGLRVFVRCLEGGALETALTTVFPGAFFYLVYSVLFYLILDNPAATTVFQLAVTAGFCDFFSNNIELFLRFALDSNTRPLMASFYQIFWVAVIRAFFVFLILLLRKQYHFLLKREDHEARYRSLFIMNANLRSELYLMKKNSEQIEKVMKDAYDLYEQLKNTDASEALQHTGLNIAREVHDIKKDYYRVIQGIEEEIEKTPEESLVHLNDIFRILREAGYTHIQKKKLDAEIQTKILAPFDTPKHYILMSILLNLMTNALEAVEGCNRTGVVSIQEWREGDNYFFRVEDNGAGISERRLPHIFEMGYSSKFNAETGNIYRGVGLNSVKQLVEETLKGSIRVSSREGEGTVFLLSFPVTELEGGEA